jgi:uncharacterized membrane protein YwzB
MPLKSTAREQQHFPLLITIILNSAVARFFVTWLDWVIAFVNDGDNSDA